VRPCVNDPELLALLRVFQRTLLQVKLEEVEDGSFKPVFQILPEFNLEELAISDSKQYRVQPEFTLATDVSRELLHAAAKTVVVNTPGDTALTKLAEVE
jgi:hypothetical protein